MKKVGTRHGSPTPGFRSVTERRTVAYVANPDRGLRCHGTVAYGANPVPSLSLYLSLLVLFYH